MVRKNLAASAGEAGCRIHAPEGFILNVGKDFRGAAHEHGIQDIR